MKVVGLFSGVGGIELGFMKAGFTPIWSNEIDENAAKTFRLNHKHSLIVDDIKNIESKNIPTSSVIVGGFPCQAFSVAGYRKGFFDERGEIFFQMARVIKDKKPRVIFIENVKNLKTHDNKKTFLTIRETLESFGYHLKDFILNASEYGNIPQNRERIYIIGFLYKKDFDNFKEIKPIKLTTKISDIVSYDKKVDDKFYYKNSSLYEKIKLEIVKKDTLYQWRRVYVRENKSNLCPTLTANMGTGGHNVPLILTKWGIRKLTPKECFSFQGYEDDFILPNIANSHLYKQAGNSVVISVIKRLAIQIKNAIKN